jgi:CHAD domain-containing protein
VLLGTLDDLVRTWPGKKPDSLRKLRAHFSVRLDEALQAFDRTCGFAKLARQLGRARRRVKRWTRAGDGWKAFGPGVARQYQQAHVRMAQAYRAGTGDAFHAWRRSVKSHRHQLHALMDLWPQELKGRVDQLDRLGDLLGEEHDLTVLESVLAATPLDVLDRPAHVQLLKQLDRRRDQRRAQARSLGAPLFREQPGVFKRRLKTAFRAL